jgi:hypothetical protein
MLHANIALAVVIQIEVTNIDEPVATGEVLTVINPWKLDEAALQPIAYTYTVPAEEERAVAEGA